ncbi:MAG: hypothetical protein AAFP19_21195, partial [Bacteroidota bacterium]
MKSKFSRIQLLVGCLLIFLISHLQGQNWLNIYPETDRSHSPHHLLETADGGFLMAALSWHTPDTTDHGLLLLKTDSQGEEEWNRFIPIGHYRGLDTERANDVELFQNQAGNVMVLSSVYYQFDPLSYHPTYYLAELDGLGNAVWAIRDTGFHANALLQTQDGQYLIIGGIGGIGPQGGNKAIKKLDANGNSLWTQFFPYPGITNGYAEKEFRDVVEMDNGDLILIGEGLDYSNPGSNCTRAFLMRLDSQGNLLSVQPYGQGEPAVRLYDIEKSNNGDLLLAGHAVLCADSWVQNEASFYVARLDAQGQLLWSHSNTGQGSGERFNSHLQIAKTHNGEILLTGFFPDLYMTGASIPYTHLRPDGQLARIQYLDLLPNAFFRQGTDIITTSDGQLAMTGNLRLSNHGGANKIPFIIKFDLSGVLNFHRLQGKAYHDTNNNCSEDLSEANLSNWTVKAQHTDFPALTYYDLTDQAGNYSLDLIPGTYDVSFEQPNAYWEVCESPFTIEVSAGVDSTVQDWSNQSLISCPLLEASISSAAIRPCFDSLEYVVQYCNKGTISATNAYLEVTLHDQLLYEAATRPLSSQNGQLLTFDLGTLASGDCDQFKILFHADCNISVGESICSEVHIYPDTLCPPISWEGPNILASAVCDGDSVRFTLSNGGADMVSSNKYIIIEDNIILKSNSFQLNSGGIETITISTKEDAIYFIRAEQADGFPRMLGDSLASARVGACEGVGNPEIFAQFAMDDGEAFFDIDCRAATAAFDPNDKSAFPTGFGPSHLINDNTDLEYLIRFQNIGTDTAFQVINKDTLYQLLKTASIRNIA